MALATPPSNAHRAHGSTAPVRPTRALAHAIVIHRAEVVRAGISSILTTTGIGDATGAASVFDGLQIASIQTPQIIIFDYARDAGPEVCRLLAGIWPRPRLVAIVGPNQVTSGQECLAAGADAAIAIESVSGALFAECVRQALAGNGPVIAGFGSRGGSAPWVDEAPTGVLTRREREMLYLIGEGLSNREIADMLVLSVKTIEAHRSNLSRKLNIRSRAGLMRLAMSSGAA